MCMEYDTLLKTLKETLFWFRNLSPLAIENFDENDAHTLVKIVPGLNDSLLLIISRNKTIDTRYCSVP